MNFLKKICYLIMILFAIFCGFLILCAVRPEVAEAVTKRFNPNQEQTAVPEKGDRDSSREEKAEEYHEIPKEDIVIADEPDLKEEGLADDMILKYIQPDQSEISVPDNVSGRNGYQQVQDEGGQIADEEAERLQKQIGMGNTGDGLIFDAVYYPYYAMLDEKGRHLYRQIYANAGDLYRRFAPAEAVTAAQLKNIFAAVYNDHPELFWLETAYSGIYKRNGECVEIDLKFNRTADNLEGEKAVFHEKENEILDQAAYLENGYEKEKLVHDMLIDRITYSKSAEMNQSAYSALVNGQTVCAGYARAFQYLMQQLGIPCYYCTGYAGENHAWNIVLLDDGYYNVDATWDDTEGGNYDYFNKTDEDYSYTHVRQDLSVYLPPCSGQLYRSPEQTKDGSGMYSQVQESRGDDVHLGQQEKILYDLSDYYGDCYDQITAAGKGSYEFINVVEGAELLQEIYEAYSMDDYKQGYMQNAMTAVSANSCEMSLTAEELAENRYLITHKVTLR